MTPLHGKTALVIGASSGTGRATAKALLSEGASVVAVARGERALDALAGETGERLRTVTADAADSSTAQRLMHEFRPQLVVLAAGVRPHTAPIDEQTWETFSQPWNGDTRAAFHLVQAALSLPLAEGSTVAIVSSGAAIGGSPMSGGYAGAKRMQWLLAEYAQDVSDAKQLGIRFLAVIPRQFIEGTAIGAAAAEAYPGRKWNVPLTAETVAAAIVGGLRGDQPDGVTAVGVTGESVEPLE